MVLLLVVMTYYVGVDVGTGSVRAALVDVGGRILKKSTNAIKTWNPEIDFYQQSSEDIWRCCCKVVRVRNEKYTYLCIVLIINCADTATLPICVGFGKRLHGNHTCYNLCYPFTHRKSLKEYRLRQFEALDLMLRVH